MYIRTKEEKSPLDLFEIHCVHAIAEYVHIKRT